MAFCTKCGATLNGAFCTSCGAPVGPAAAPPPAASAATAAVPAAPAAKRRTSPWVWILIVILGLFVVGGIATVGAGYFLFQKVRQAGVDPELMRRNPGYAVAKAFLAGHSDLVEVRHDDNTGTITVRDRRTGKETTISFDDLQHGRFTVTADSDTGGTARIDFGEGSGKLPSWVPQYPGSAAKASFSVTGENGSGTGAGGNYTFTTPDAPSAVISFYQGAAEKLGMKAEMTNASQEGGMFRAADEDNERSLTVMVGRSVSETSVNLTYAMKR